MLEIGAETPGLLSPDNPYPWIGLYFNDVPIELAAQPVPDHRFVGWRLDGAPEWYSTDEVIELTLNGDTTVEAVFEPIPLAEQPVGLHVWDFEDEATYLLPSDTVGGGVLTFSIGTVSVVSRNDSAQDFDTAHLRINNPIGAEIRFDLPTTDYEEIKLAYETRRSGQGAGIQRLAYTTNGIDWIDWQDYPVYDAAPQLQEWDFSGIAGTSDNADFAVRITFEQGAGGDAGNNRFDNVALSGVALPGVNLPPVVVESIDLVRLIESGTMWSIDLETVFEDPDEDVLTFLATSDNTNVVSASVDGLLLTIDPVLRGGTKITLSADDGQNSPVETTFRVLVYPSAHALENGPYQFGY